MAALACALVCIVGCGSKPEAPRAVEGPLRDVLASGAGVELVLTGFAHADGPVWTRGGRLLFSDTLADRLYLWDEPGPPVVFRSPSGHPAGNVFDAEGRLVTAQHDRTVTRTDERGMPIVIADRHAGHLLNGPNDVAIGPEGRIYFVDATYAITGNGPDSAEPELPACGIYRVGTDGAAERLARDRKQPNGLAFSPDGSRLYVTDDADDSLYRYPVNADGTLGAARKVATFDRALGETGDADGVAVDADGTVFAVGPGGLWIYGADDRLVGRVAVPGIPTDVTIGGRDGRALFITAKTRIYRLRLAAR